jgi:hypothetical protein
MYQEHGRRQWHIQKFLERGRMYKNMQSTKSPAFSFKGFSLRVYLQKNWKKVDTYVKIVLAIVVARYTADQLLQQFLVGIGATFIMDALHYFIVKR